MAGVENNQSGSRGGKRAGSGRKKGAATRKTREIADAAIADGGLTPLEYMLEVMRTEPASELDARDMLAAVTMRFEAAKAAAPYIHPRLQAIQVSSDPDEPLMVQIVTRKIVNAA